MNDFQQAALDGSIGFPDRARVELALLGLLTLGLGVLVTVLA